MSVSEDTLQRQDTGDSDGGWDIVDDLPLRWAADYVSLATAGSRLANVSVLKYVLWQDDTQHRNGALLAVATKSSVLLYESPRGERAFRFLKVIEKAMLLFVSSADERPHSLPTGLLYPGISTRYRVRSPSCPRRYVEKSVGRQWHPASPTV
jgi:hypothetical protein